MPAPELVSENLTTHSGSTDWTTQLRIAARSDATSCILRTRRSMTDASIRANRIDWMEVLSLFVGDKRQSVALCYQRRLVNNNKTEFIVGWFKAITMVTSWNRYSLFYRFCKCFDIPLKFYCSTKPAILKYFGVRVFWPSGFVASWCSGLLICWFSGLLVFYLSVLLPFWSSGLLLLWSTDLIAFWLGGFLIYCFPCRLLFWHSVFWFSTFLIFRASDLLSFWSRSLSFVFCNSCA